MRVRNISPHGDLSLPTIGEVVAHGADIGVSRAVAASLLANAESWEPADDAAAALLAKLTPPDPADLDDAARDLPVKEA